MMALWYDSDWMVGFLAGLLNWIKSVVQAAALPLFLLMAQKYHILAAKRVLLFDPSVLMWDDWYTDPLEAGIRSMDVAKLFLFTY